MKAKELMIGDWVQVAGTPTQIRVIDAQDETITYNNGRFGSLKEVTEYLQHIPLTPEILKQNGWKKCNGDLYAFMTETAAPLCMEWNDSNKALFINDGLVPNPICNIHQLQHALRLCGIEKEITL